MPKLVCLFFLLSALWYGCGAKKESPPPTSAEPPVLIRDLSQIQTSDTLRAATMPGITSYFLFRKTIMGYDYELVSNLAKYLDVQLDLQVVHTEQELIQLLRTGAVDIIAYNMYETKALKKDFLFVFPRFKSHQVLIQRLGRNSLLSASDLARKEIHVKHNSIYHRQLSRLNEEMGGSIHIRFTPDSLTTDDLIEQVLNNEIDYTASYYDRASIHRIYSHKLENHVPLGFTQHSGWLVHKNAPELREVLERWEAQTATQRLQQRLESKYKLRNPYLAGRNVKIPEGALSPYDELFKKYAPEIGWDWRMLASMAFHESTFDSASISPVGASGLMQLMPRTAEIYGVDSSSIFHPEENIKASVAYLRDIGKLFRKVENSDERTKFILAGYNGGPYHVVDAMALAERYGRNPYIWYNNVEYFLDQKKTPEFYKDSVVKYGSFNARETVRYVDNILSTYESYLNQ